MSYTRLIVQVADRDVDAVCEALSLLGAIAVSVQAADDEQVLEPAPGTAPLWRANAVSALFDADVDRDALMARATAHLAGWDVGTPSFAVLDDQDWSQAWRQQAVTQRFGDGLWVIPTDAPTPPSAEAVVRLDPGLAFGTGAHATTALCLEWLGANRVQGLRVLDLGCGSGILALAAAKRGAAEVLAVDHDPQALDASAENARRNAVLDRVQVSHQMPTGGVDVVLANILANTLVELAPAIAACHRAGGALVLSGLLVSQTDAVWDAYASTYEALTLNERDGWVAASAVRRRDECI